jgi:hypothetical protein
MHPPAAPAPRPWRVKQKRASSPTLALCAARASAPKPLRHLARIGAHLTPAFHLLPSAPPQPQRLARGAAIRPQVHARLRAHKEASRPVATSAATVARRARGLQRCCARRYAAGAGSWRRTATSAHAARRPQEGAHND